MKAHVIELFAGSRSIAKAAKQLGHTTVSTDIHPFDGVDFVMDARDLRAEHLRHEGPTILWASPPCTGFSVAAIGKCWTKTPCGPEPKSDSARLGLELLRKTLELIDELQPDVWFIENPRGMMRKMPEMYGLPRATVTYCQYGDTRMKPTDIWTNCTTWRPKPMCKPGADCHEAAPRGSKTGTQGLKNNHERSKIPEQLCLEVLKAATEQL